MNKNLKILVGLAVVVVLVWAVWSFQKGQPGETGAITIGFIGPLTGDASSIGTVARTAAEIAVEEINAEGGIDGRLLAMVYEDGQCNAKAATNAANKLINIDKVPVIIGGACSTETAAFVPAAMQSKTVVFSYCSSAPSLSQAGEYFFRSYPSDAFQGKFAAEYIYNTLGARKVAIIYHISEWGTGVKTVFAERFRELGGEILGEEGTPQDGRDYRTQLSKIKGLGADLIYAPMYPEGSTVALKQAQELGITTRFFGADGWGDPKLQSDVSGRGDFWFTEPYSPSVAEFQAKVLARTGGEQVPICVPNAYDNVKIIAQVMREVGTDPAKIQAALGQVQYSGVSGSISFDQNGDLTTGSYVVKRMEGGGAVEVK